MFEGLSGEVIRETPEIDSQMAELTAEAQRLIDEAWAWAVESDNIERMAAEAESITNAAWDSAMDTAVNIKDVANESGKNAVYLGGRAVLGVGKLVESSIDAIGTMAKYTMGDHEGAAETAQSSIVEDVADDMAQVLDVDEDIVGIGDVTEVVGEVAAGIALAFVAPEGAAAVAVDGAMALATSGETLHAAAEDGSLEDTEVAMSTVVGVASAAISAGINKASKLVAKTPVGKFVSEKVDDVVGSFTNKVDDVAESTDDVVDAITHEADDMADASVDAVDDVSHPVTDVDDGAANPTANATDDVAETAVEKIKCINERYEGTVHPDTGVPFNRRVIEQESGRVIEGVFPEFDSFFDAKMGRELFGESSYMQVKECNRQLYEAIKKSPELRERFTAEQLEQIMDGITSGQAPDGFVWHHNEREGVMQLVDSSIHADTRHTGGHSIWDHK